MLSSWLDGAIWCVVAGLKVGIPLYGIACLAMSILYWRENWRRPTFERALGTIFIALAWPVILGIIMAKR